MKKASFTKSYIDLNRYILGAVGLFNKLVPNFVGGCRRKILDSVISMNMKMNQRVLTLVTIAGASPLDLGLLNEYC